MSHEVYLETSPEIVINNTVQEILDGGQNTRIDGKTYLSFLFATDELGCPFDPSKIEDHNLEQGILNWATTEGIYKPGVR